MTLKKTKTMNPHRRKIDYTTLSIKRKQKVKGVPQQHLMNCTYR